jgi:UDP:flavonoid glycosyltransferase YjiC (YdhE family)
MALFGGPAGAALRERLRDARKYRQFFDDYLTLLYEKQLVEVWDACQGSDVVLCWPWTRIGPSLAEALDVPVFIVSMYPPLHLPTAEFANPFQWIGGAFPSGAPSGAEIRRSWRLALPAMTVGAAPLNRWRAEKLGLPPIGWREDLRRLRKMPHLLGYSPAVLPRPKDWPADVHVTGFWWLDTPIAYEPPPALAAFLATGDPPIGIGFSSQVGRDTAAVNALVIEAAKQADVRVVLIGGFGALPRGELPSHVCSVPSVPYDWLFTRVRAFVHQGGSGTTGSALRFGLPNFAVTFGYEQALWGHRLHALGVGPAPLEWSGLTVETLAAALRLVATDATMAARAKALGLQIAKEDGVGDAVALVRAACAPDQPSSLRPAK